MTAKTISLVLGAMILGACAQDQMSQVMTSTLLSNPSTTDERAAAPTRIETTSIPVASNPTLPPPAAKASVVQTEVRRAAPDTRTPGTIFKSANWSVLRTKNSMTDKISCLAVYKQRPEIQLYASDFYISMRGRGGVQGYQLRFDDEPATEMRLPDNIARQMSVIHLTGSEVRKLVSSRRLRISGLTVLDTGINFDLELADIRMAHAVLVGPDCA